jgi:hypothetical protein
LGKIKGEAAEFVAKLMAVLINYLCVNNLRWGETTQKKV